MLKLLLCNLLILGALVGIADAAHAAAQPYILCLRMWVPGLLAVGYALFCGVALRLLALWNRLATAVTAATWLAWVCVLFFRVHAIGSYARYAHVCIAGFLLLSIAFPVLQKRRADHESARAEP